MLKVLCHGSALVHACANDIIGFHIFALLVVNVIDRFANVCKVMLE